MNDPDRTDGFIDDLTDRLGFADVVAALADAAATTPPATVRRGLLATIAARPRRPVVAAPVPDLYALRVAAMAALLDELSGPDWAIPATPYDWTVHGLVAHLTLIEEYTLRQFGLTDLAPLPVGAATATRHLDVGADALAEMVVGDPRTTVRRWRAAADRIVAHVQGERFDPSAATPLHAWPFDAIHRPGRPRVRDLDPRR